jgi:predicted alpha/beta hydrolase
MSPQDITASDGTAIAARFFAPAGEARGAVLIVPAMGTPQDYYRPFAEWLAAQGYWSATFDYRGSGLSRRGALRGFKADLFDWARLDCAAMVDALAARAGSAPLYWIGHSLGGQILALVPNRERVAKAITIATGSGYWLENVPALRLRVWWLWFFLVPVTLRLFGYFPGRALRNTESIHGFYSAAPRTMRRIAPGDIGVARIGHFGFFRARFADALWRRYVLPELAGETGGT